MVDSFFAIYSCFWKTVASKRSIYYIHERLECSTIYSSSPLGSVSRKWSCSQDSPDSAKFKLNKFY